MSFDELQKLALEKIEKEIQAIKEKARKGELSADSVADIIANINFAHQLNIFSSSLATELKRKIQTSLAEFKRLERLETRDIVNDFENPREIARRYYDMDSYNTQIAKERELDHLKSVNSSVQSNDTKGR